jgi:Right handed beta helix region
MSRKVAIRVVVALVLSVAVSSVARAQATRTWVSGVGDDANPCSRTAPCKTFAGAISKTAGGGEINVLDPGGFGAVTITKAITISSEGFEAGVLVSGTNGIIVNAGTNDVVVLRGLDFEGLGTGLNGIRFLAGAALYVEKCTIDAFNGSNGLGIDFEPSGASQLYVTDTIVRNNRVGGGILVKPGSGGSAKGVLDNVRSERNTFGLRVESFSNVSVKNSVLSGNSSNGLAAISTGAALNVIVDHTVLSNNAGFGILSSGNNGVVEVGDSTLSGNGTGLGFSGNGALLSFGNNLVAGNTADGAPSGPAPQL